MMQRPLTAAAAAGKESCDSCAPGWTYSYDKEKCVKDKPKKG